jgi:teichuronic acid biosynthesis glycosyltransferase TuaG
MNLVTVIIPYFKKKEFFHDCINSALNQTYKNLEIIIIYDDNEKDELEFIKQIKKKDNRIILIINPKSLGAGMSRNKAIEQASGNYIGFLDADDIWVENKVEVQIKYMQDNDLKISHTSYKIIDKDKKILGNRRARDFYTTRDLLKSCDIGLSTVMLKKEILSTECSFPSLKTKEDFVLWLKILQKQIKIISIDESLVYWRKLDTSLSSSTIQKLKDGYKVYNHFMKFNLFKSAYYVFCLCVNFLKKR